MYVKLSKIFIETIAKLRKDGIDPDLEDIILLYEIVKNSEEKSDTNLISNKGKRIGNLVLFPLTFGAKLWLMDDVAKWFCDDNEEDNLYAVIANIYASFYSFDKIRFKFKSREHCKKALKSFAKNIQCIPNELVEALTEMNNEYEIKSDYQKILELLFECLKEYKEKNTLDINKIEMFIKRLEKKSKEDNRFAPVLALLMANFSQPKNYFLWECSEKELCIYLKEYLKVEAEKWSDKKNKKIDEESARDLVRLNGAISFILKKHKFLNANKEKI